MLPSWWYDGGMASKHTSPSKGSFDNIATREVWGAVSRHDVDGLRRALARKGNPNDQKAINPWSPPSTPLLDAAGNGFLEGIEILVNAGARRRASGKKGVSAYAKALLAKSRESFEALDRSLGAMTQAEIVECVFALGSLQNSAAAIAPFDQWQDLILQSLERHQTRLSSKTAVSVAMVLLGGEGHMMAMRPEMVQRMMASGIMPADALAVSADLEGLEEWATQIGRRKWDEENQVALDLIMELGFPFASAELVCCDDVRPFLRKQRAIAEHESLDVHSSNPASTSRARPRL